VSEAIICEVAGHLYSDNTKDTPVFSPKKNQMVVMLRNHNSQLVDSR
jgi:hypothetical protein